MGKDDFKRLWRLHQEAVTASMENLPDAKREATRVHMSTMILFDDEDEGLSTRTIRTSDELAGGIAG